MPPALHELHYFLLYENNVDGSNLFLTENIQKLEPSHFSIRHEPLGPSNWKQWSCLKKKQSLPFHNCICRAGPPVYGLDGVLPIPINKSPITIVDNSFTVDFSGLISHEKLSDREGSKKTCHCSSDCISTHCRRGSRPRNVDRLTFV